MRKRESYITKYGPEVGPRIYHLLQSQAAHASVAARLRRKIEAMSRGVTTPTLTRSTRPSTLPLFPDLETSDETVSLAAESSVG